MPDLYTKAILTVIAIALCVLAVQNAVAPARALDERCGFTMDQPCWIISRLPLDVIIRSSR